MSIDKYLETIIHFASTEQYSREVLQAREEYFSTLGYVSEEEDDYEEKLRRFLDWYIFDRPLSDTGKSPVETFYEKLQRTFNEDDENTYSEFRKSIQSLFIVKKSEETGVQVKDLITRRKHFVEYDVPKGFVKDEIFQARLIPFQGGFRFGESFCFHPISANKIILKRLKSVDRKRLDQVRVFLDDLLQRRRRSERYRHVDSLRFYEEKD